MFVKVTAGISCHLSQSSNPPWPDCRFPPPGCFHEWSCLCSPIATEGWGQVWLPSFYKPGNWASSIWASVTIVDPAGGKTWQRPQSFTVLITVAPSPEKMWKTMFPEVKTGTRIVRGKPLRCGVMTHADKPGILAQAFKPSMWGWGVGRGSGTSSLRSGWSV